MKTIITINTSRDVVKAIDDIAKKEQRSRSNLIEIILRNFVESKKKNDVVMYTSIFSEE